MIVLWIILGVVLFIVLALFFIGYLFWFKAIPKKKPDTYKGPYQSNDNVMKSYYPFKDKIVERLKGLDMEEVWITSRDGLKLHGYFKEAQYKTNRTIISVHGYSGSAFSTAPAFSHFLVDFNYNMLFIDLRTYGMSEGKYVGYGIKDSYDVLDWVEFVKERVEDASICLFGISLGGNTVACASDKVPDEVKCIIDDCGYTSAWDEFAHIIKDAYHLPTFILYFAQIWNKIFAHYGFKDEDARRSLSKSKCPVLFIHGSSDTFVPYSMGKENYDACSSRKELKTYEGIEHARCYFENKDSYTRLVLNFLARYL